MSQEQKRVSAREFKEKVELGWKRPALMEYFGIPNTRVTEYLQQLDLRIKSTRGGGSILVLDLDKDTIISETQNSNQLKLPFDVVPETIVSENSHNDQEIAHNVEIYETIENNTKEAEEVTWQ